MASLKSPWSHSLVLTFFLVSSASWVLASRNLEEVSSPAPQPNDFLRQCQLKIVEHCEEDIVSSVFGNGTVSDECCRELVNFIGYSCHTVVVEGYTFLHPEAERAKALENSKSIWLDCSARVH